MNQKIPFHELAKRLSLATSITNESAEVFIKNFFDLLSETIVKGETVRIKGLGTFSPASIDSENCVEFTPDKDIADTLNAPFAPFEAVELNDEVTDEMLAETTDAPTPNEPEPTKSDIEEPVEPPVEAIPQIAAPTVSSEEIVLTAPQTESQTDSEIEIKSEIEDAPVQVEPLAPTPDLEVKSETEKLPESEPEPAPVKAEEPATIPSSVSNLPATKDVPEEKPVVKYALEEEPEEYVEHISEEQSSNNGSFGWGFLVGLLVGLALGACAVYLAIDYLFPYGRMERTEQVADPNTEEIVLTEEPTAVEPVDTVSQPQEAASTTSIPETTPASEPVKEEAPQATATQQATASKTVYDTVRKGYSLTHMAKKHYGSKDFWVYIYEENKAKIKNPNRVQPGEVFVIPAPEKYGINASSEESITKAKNKAGQILSKFK